MRDLSQCQSGAVSPRLIQSHRTADGVKGKLASAASARRLWRLLTPVLVGGGEASGPRCRGIATWAIGEPVLPSRRPRSRRTACHSPGKCPGRHRSPIWSTIGAFREPTKLGGDPKLPGAASRLATIWGRRARRRIGDIAGHGFSCSSIFLASKAPRVRPRILHARKSAPYG